MAGFKLPTKSQVSFIDLEKYGGEGKLAIHPPKVVDSLAFREYIKEMAKKDGIIVIPDRRHHRFLRAEGTTNTVSNHYWDS